MIAIGGAELGTAMRVTIVTETYMPQVNGVSRTLAQLVRVLSDRGDTVQLVHPNYGEAPWGPHDRLVRAINPWFYRELFLPLPPFGRAHRAIASFRPDIIHVASEATLGLSVLRFALRAGFPVVSSFHTNFDQYTSHYGMGWARGPIWRYLRWFHNRTRETYVASRATIAGLNERGFERLVLWRRGVDGTLFRPDRQRRDELRAALGFRAGDVVIAHVGRLAWEKNVEALGDALASVTSTCPTARVLIVGDGPARPGLESRLGPSARFAGYRTGDDLADHYAAADLFAFASKTETFGNVILEAMASGLPVVAYRAGGPSEIVRDGITGVLVDSEAPPEEFARALTRLVNDAPSRDAMAGAARDYALTQTWDAIMSELRSRYQRVVDEAKPIAAAVGGLS